MIARVSKILYLAVNYSQGVQNTLPYCELYPEYPKILYLAVNYSPGPGCPKILNLAVNYSQEGVSKILYHAVHYSQDVQKYINMLVSKKYFTLL